MSTAVPLFWALGHCPLGCGTDPAMSLAVPRRSQSVAAVGSGSLLRCECRAPLGCPREPKQMVAEHGVFAR